MPIPKDEAIARLNAFHEQMDEAALRGEERLEEVLRNAPEGVGVHEIDEHMVITRVNPEELRMMRYQENEMVGRPVFEFVVMQEASQRSVEQKLKGAKELKPFVRSLKRGDGTAIAVVIVERYRKDALGKIAGIRTAIHEIAVE
jgi:PAS domain S-box-containing protein